MVATRRAKTVEFYIVIGHLKTVLSVDDAFEFVEKISPDLDDFIARAADEMVVLMRLQMPLVDELIAIALAVQVEFVSKSHIHEHSECPIDGRHTDVLVALRESVQNFVGVHVLFVAFL